MNIARVPANKNISDRFSDRRWSVLPLMQNIEVDYYGYPSPTDARINARLGPPPQEE